jgi:hypothetical protein
MHNVDFRSRLRRAIALAVFLIVAIVAVGIKDDVKDVVLSRVFIEPPTPDPDEPTEEENNIRDAGRQYTDYSVVTNISPMSVGTARLVLGQSSLRMWQFLIFNLFTALSA